VPVRVAIADHHALVREGIALLVQRDAGLSVVGQAGDADGIPAMLARSGCDVLLLDLYMDGNTAVDIASLARQVKVIVLTESEQPSDAAAAIRAGARGFISKRYAADTMIQAIHAVACGGTWLTPDLRT